MDNRSSVELLESIHCFPGTYRIKAIGVSADDFAGRVIEAAGGELATPSELEHTVRATPSGRHVAITLELTVQTAEQVLAVYAAIQRVEGLTFLF